MRRGGSRPTSPSCRSYCGRKGYAFREKLQRLSDRQRTFVQTEGTAESIRNEGARGAPPVLTASGGFAWGTQGSTMRLEMPESAQLHPKNEDYGCELG